MSNDAPEYAPEYTKRERILFLLKHMIWCVPLYAVTELWFFDWLAKYSDNANCYDYGHITGVHLVMYGLFVGIPLSSAILVALFMGPRAVKVIRLRQHPLPGEKVFKKTKYVYGNKAKIQPIVLFCFIGLLLIVSIWGAMQADKLMQDIKPCKKLLVTQVAE